MGLNSTYGTSHLLGGNRGCPPTPPPKTITEAEQMARDPVCGMEVNPREDNYSTEYQGEVYRFCSTSCKEGFEKNPTEYARAMPVDHSSEEHEGHFGGCCGGGMGRGWMGYIHLAMMILFLLLLLLYR